MTRKLQNRRCVIINQLSELSKDSWRHAKPCDYEPLERELRDLEAALSRRKERRQVDILNRIERL
jgi:hypothetical protein